jgi:hypothetical protein
MALSMDFTGGFGHTPNAYFRIERLTITRVFNQSTTHTTHLDVCGYIDSDAGVNQKQPVSFMSFDTGYLADHTAAYNWLKTQPDFLTATDVLEDM